MFNRRTFRILTLAIVFQLFMNTPYLFSQNDEMVSGNKKPKIWKKWRQKERFNSQPFNPYLDKKKKLPSAQISKQDKKEIKNNN